MKPPPLKSDPDMFDANGGRVMASPSLPGGIVFEDPPLRGGRGHAIWLERLTPLLQHPGRWARVHVFDKPSSGSATANQLRRGKATIPPGRWSFQGAKVDGGKSALYARYDGPEEAPE